MFVLTRNENLTVPCVCVLVKEPEKNSFPNGPCKNKGFQENRPHYMLMWKKMLLKLPQNGNIQYVVAVKTI